MNLDIISYKDLLLAQDKKSLRDKLAMPLQQKGIIGIKDVPEFEKKTRAYIQAARQFAALEDAVKEQYAPNRDAGETEGYELGAEWFQDHEGHWRIDNKKASFYAFVPDDPRNKWSKEIDLKTPYLALGELIFATGKHLLRAIGVDENLQIPHEHLTGYGRMLHYHKEILNTVENPNWCGAHFDHGIFTGLVPAYYFQEGIEIDEPAEAGLYIAPTDTHQFEKIYANDKSILLFQVGEFGQLVTNDAVQATEHVVKKTAAGIERFAFALFYSANENTIIHSRSKLTADARYVENQFADGSISYGKWQAASFARYRAR